MTHGSLFSGIGGFDLAAQWMGWKNVFQVEIDPFCQKVLEKNFPNVARSGDIKEFNGTKYRGTIDVLSGGFPCQNISIVGDRKGITGAKSGLWGEMYRIIKEVNPSFVVIENSTELLKKGFEQVLYPLSEIGYDAEWQCFQAKDFGFPHERKRIFIVAYSNGLGREGDNETFRVLPKDFSWSNVPDKTSNLLLPLRRFDREGNYESVRMDDGFSDELDKGRISGCGNAIVPQVAFEIFKAIEKVNNSI